MSDETYNGWTNRETWAVALHINNDQGWQESIHEVVRDALAELDADPNPWDVEHGNVTPQAKARVAGDVIRESIEEMVQLSIEEPAMHTRDLRMALQDFGSLWRVNWTELGGAFLDDLANE